jgi:hypothetical protein
MTSSQSVFLVVMFVATGVFVALHNLPWGVNVQLLDSLKESAFATIRFDALAGTHAEATE